MPKIVVVPKELYYHEVAYVRGLEASASAMLAALELVSDCDMDDRVHRVVKAAIAAAKAAGIKEE